MCASLNDTHVRHLKVISGFGPIFDFKRWLPVFDVNILIGRKIRYLFELFL